MLNHILRDETHKQRIAVVVNDMAEVNIDADLVSTPTDNHGAGGDQDDKMVQLQNGCICCTLRDDLVLELAGLVQKGDIEHIVVESTGISEPLPVAQTFTAPINHNKQLQDQDEKQKALMDAVDGLDSLSDIAHLHSLVTVVDASTFLTYLDSTDDLEELNMGAAEGDARPLSFLLAEQVQFANLLLVNKTDLASAETLGNVESLLRYLNPSAAIERTRNSAINVPSFLNNRSYDESEFINMPEWAEELAKQDSHVPETEEYGIGS